MLSKGIDTFAIVGIEGASITFSIPDDYGDGTQSAPYSWSSGPQPVFQLGNIQLYEDDIPVLSHYGQFTWTAQVSGQTVGTQFWEIAPSTGSMDTSNGPYNMMQQTGTSNSTGNWALSYGFYDSGSGYSGLSNQDQSWVYLTPDMSNWMGDLVQQHPQIGAGPLSAFVLPGAHDAGMYDTTAIESLSDLATVLGAVVAAVGTLTLGIIVPFLGPLLQILETANNLLLCKALQNFSVTQVNPPAIALDMGVRYFDFRPGYCCEGVPLSGIYHQHAFIPGATYQDFLEGVFGWLLNNPSEVVVISANFQGFAQTSMQPSVATLQQVVNAAQQSAGAQNIKTGGPADLVRSYNDLAHDKMQVIFLNQIDDNPDDPNNVPKYDSYAPAAYATTQVGPILQALAGMNQAGQAGSTYTVMQLQGTSQSASGVAPAVISDDSWSGSSLMMTKAQFDSATYPWLIQNLRNNLGSNQLIVLLNDFCDNALASVAMSIMAAG